VRLARGRGSRDKPKIRVPPVLRVHGAGTDGTGGTHVFWIRQLYVNQGDMSMILALPDHATCPLDRP